MSGFRGSYVGLQIEPMSVTRKANTLTLGLPPDGLYCSVINNNVKIYTQWYTTQLLKKDETIPL